MTEGKLKQEPATGIAKYAESAVNILRTRPVRTILYGLISVNVLVYNSWPDLQLLLYKNKVYHWRCTDSDQLGYANVDDICEDQYKQVQLLFTMAQSAEFICTVFAGMSVDYLGPRMTSILGNIMLFSGWLLVLYSVQSFPLYPLGMFLIGGSVNMLAFPCLELGMLYPSYKHVAMAFLVCIQYFSIFIPTILQKFAASNPTYTTKYLIGMYLLCVCVPLFLIGLVSHPKHRLVDSLDAHTSKLSKSAPPEGPLDEVSGSPEIQTKNVELEKDSIHKSGVLSSLGSKLCHFVKDKEMTSFRFLTFLAIYCTTTLCHGYYPTIVRERFSEPVANVFSYFLLVQGVCGLGVGYLAQFIGGLMVYQVINILYVCAVATALTYVEGLHYVATVCYIVANSYIYVTKYTFVLDYFGPDHFGFLVGFIGTAAGTFNLLNLIFESLSTSGVMLPVYAFTMLACMASLFYLQLRLRASRVYVAPAKQPLEP